jgi:hypothetical protein
MIYVTSSGRSALLALLLAAGVGFALGAGRRVRASVLAAARRLGRSQ